MPVLYLEWLNLYITPKTTHHFAPSHLMQTCESYTTWQLKLNATNNSINVWLQCILLHGASVQHINLSEYGCAWLALIQVTASWNFSQNSQHTNSMARTPFITDFNWTGLRPQPFHSDASKLTRSVCSLICGYNISKNQENYAARTEEPTRSITREVAWPFKKLENLIIVFFCVASCFLPHCIMTANIVTRFAHLYFWRSVDPVCKCNVRTW